ncbi:MAG: hypothetical protein D6748_08995 [Calditrichaeota bacterium]|nr:MAG: hypothetical protein D6748_08995 [Calditrichota bacterium]
MTIGVIAIGVAFVASIVSATAYLMYHKERFESTLKLANRAFYVMTGGIIFSLAYLLYLIMTHQFDVNYVYSYSSMALNKFYLFSTLWAGQQGTFLLWLFYTSIYGLILMRKTAVKKPLVMVVLVLMQVTLLWILLKKSPFSMIWHIHEEAPIGFKPADGAGLNPLLQNPWMVIHPPTLFVGYSSTVVPFAFAMHAMLTGNFRDWVKEARPWIVFSVMILGTGIIMGGYWAYVTLGWGGYWGWDPVENASLVPWLLGIALLHGTIIQTKRNALIRSNFWLAGGAFLAMLWGSFLTRSGVLTDFSVHSFAPSGLTFYLVMAQVLFLLFFLWGYYKFLVFFKEQKIEPTRFDSGLLNREVFMFAGLLVVLFLALVVLFGTSAPLYTQLLGEPSSVSPDYYNKMIIPVAIFMLLTIALAPILAWKTSELRNKNTLLLGLGVAALATVIAIMLGLRNPISIPVFFLAVFVITTNFKVTMVLIKRNVNKAGGYLAHIGLGFMVIGIITSSVYDRSEKVMLPKGEFEKTSLGYEVKFLDFLDMPDGKDRVKLEVKTPFGTYEAYPKFYYSDYSQSYMVGPDVKVNFVKDVYISPISYTPARLANLKRFTLKKGETQHFNNLKVTFHNFGVQMGNNEQVITANLTIDVTENNYTQSYEVKPVLTASRGKMKSTEAEIPGTPYKIKINSVNPTNGTVDLALVGSMNEGETPKDQLAIEISEKPLISILWFGSIIFVIGSALTLVRRRRYREKI